jgi:hypothetical protein
MTPCFNAIRALNTPTKDIVCPLFTSTGTREQSGDGLAIWASKCGRADMLKTLLDADRSGKLFADEVNFIQVISSC